jgi:hypothetical protein
MVHTSIAFYSTCRCRFLMVCSLLVRPLNVLHTLLLNYLQVTNICCFLMLRSWLVRCVDEPNCIVFCCCSPCVDRYLCLSMLLWRRSITTWFFISSFPRFIVRSRQCNCMLLFLHPTCQTSASSKLFDSKLSLRPRRYWLKVMYRVHYSSWSPIHIVFHHQYARCFRRKMALSTSTIFLSRKDLCLLIPNVDLMCRSCKYKICACSYPNSVQHTCSPKSIGGIYGCQTSLSD